MVLLVAMIARADRIKDIASVAGVRTNQLVGYGLVEAFSDDDDDDRPATEF